MYFFVYNSTDCKRRSAERALDRLQKEIPLIIPMFLLCTFAMLPVRRACAADECTSLLQLRDQTRPPGDPAGDAVTPPRSVALVAAGLPALHAQAQAALGARASSQPVV